MFGRTLAYSTVTREWVPAVRSAGQHLFGVLGSTSVRAYAELGDHIAKRRWQLDNNPGATLSQQKSFYEECGLEVVFSH